MGNPEPRNPKISLLRPHYPTSQKKNPFTDQPMSKSPMTRDLQEIILACSLQDMRCKAKDDLSEKGDSCCMSSFPSSVEEHSREQAEAHRSPSPGTASTMPNCCISWPACGSEGLLGLRCSSVSPTAPWQPRGITQCKEVPGTSCCAPGYHCSHKTRQKGQDVKTHPNAANTLGSQE